MAANNDSNTQLMSRKTKQQQQQAAFLQQQMPHSSLLFGKSHLPIDDFYLLDNPDKYSFEEKQLRIKLTAVYRLIELNGWSMGIYNHVTIKLTQDGNSSLLIHPFGLHYNEITASSLLKIQLKTGKIIDQGTTNYELNWPGFIIHSAIHLSRPDLKCVIHLHYPPVSAASAFKYGLLPICQEQALLGNIKYLDYTGILTEEDERDAVAEAFGSDCKVMLLRNHGLIVCGETVEEAYYLLCNLIRACEAQARLLAAGGLENLVLMTPEASQQAHEMVINARYPIKQVSAQQYSTQQQFKSPSIEVMIDADDTHIVNADNETNVNNNNTNNNNNNLLSNTYYDDNSSTTSGNESDMESTSSGASSNKAVRASNGIGTGTQKATNVYSYAQSHRHMNQVTKKSIIGYLNMYELDFEAQMRNLDLAGHQTGYAYKRPLVRNYNL